MSLRCNKEVLDCILAVLPARADSTTSKPPPSSVSRSFGGSCAYKFDAYGTTEGTISASTGRNLWPYMLLKAFAPSYERMVQPSSKPSVAVSASEVLATSMRRVAPRSRSLRRLRGETATEAL